MTEDSPDGVWAPDVVAVAPPSEAVAFEDGLPGDGLPGDGLFGRSQPINREPATHKADTTSSEAAK